MLYRRLGRSGLKVSVLSFGSWVTFKNQVDVGQASESMKTAYDAGVNFFDNAEVYASGESEIIMGEALKKLKFPRDTYSVSSKVYWGGEQPTQKGLSRKHVTEACHAALKRLQVDYLDLYFCHRPDAETPVEETVFAMNDLIRQGKVFYWGTSEWSAAQIMEAYSIARQYHLVPPTMEQPQYNMFHRSRVEAEYKRLYAEIGLGTTIWSPLASGILTGKYSSGVPKDSRANIPGFEWLRDKMFSEEGKRNIEKTMELGKLANKLGVSLPKLAIAWCAKNPNVSTVILGASKIDQLKETLGSLEVMAQFTPDVEEEIEKILNNKPAQEPVF